MQCLGADFPSFATVANPFGAPVCSFAEVSSTMDVARSLADDGAKHGTVIVAARQTAGRGRGDSRRWVSEPGENLLTTVVLEVGRLGEARARLPLLVGLAVARSVEAYLDPPHRCVVKWPNDVLVSGRKIAGILCESDERFVFAGVGINVNQIIFPRDLRRPAVSIRSVVGRPVSIDDLLASLLAHLDAAIVDIRWRPEIERRLAFRGDRVFVTGNSELAGGSYVLRGIGKDGALILRGPEGEYSCYGGEIIPV
jgi:BirA family transcriptional regulator, biotin operon repressor / biotin---[acetyl-CoA-carboxylase] ligase